MYFHQSVGSSELGKFRFKPGKALKRAVKITKTSFQPKKIFGAIGSVTAGVFTAGLGPALAPKLFSANSSTMKSLGMGVTAIVVAAGAVVMAPAIAGILGPTLSSGATLAGKAVTGMQTFMTAWNKLTPKKAQELASELTPQQVADIETGKAQLTEQGVSYAGDQAPGSLRVQGQLVPEGYGSEGGASARSDGQGRIPSLSGIDPLYMLGGGVLLFLLMQKRN